MRIATKEDLKGLFTLEQKGMQRGAEERIFAVCRTFNEIMTGPNPLTRDEVRKLIKKMPDAYGILHKWCED